MTKHRLVDQPVLGLSHQSHSITRFKEMTFAWACKDVVARPIDVCFNVRFRFPIHIVSV